LKLKTIAEIKNFEYALQHTTYDVIKYLLFHTLLKEKKNLSIKDIQNFNFNLILKQETENFMKEIKKISHDNKVNVLNDDNNNKNKKIKEKKNFHVNDTSRKNKMNINDNMKKVVELVE